MDTAVLRGFATRARTDLLREVRGRLDVVLGQGSSMRTEQPGAVAALERVVAKDGRDAVIDRVAYTWFNRLIALRFMDANGYTAAGVVSPEAGRATGQPQVLSDAKGGDFDSDVVSEKVQAAVTALLNGTRPSTDPQGEAYGLLLEAYCRYWNRAMPFMFEREGDYTELLMPGGLLATESVRDRAVKTLTEEACSEVEVIGWLYQFYISERKAEVFAGFKQNKKAGPAEIPAATQLFTPHWIVRYLVENSLGHLWLLNHPESRLAEQMDYYIRPVDEETDFLKISTPEELKVIDPAAGSGHMLTYAFDLLYAIYEEESYSPSEIPAKILEHNLHGVEIDPRAGALAAFALTMKATAKRKLFLKNPVQPSICVLQNIHFDQPDLDYLWALAKGRPELSSITRADFDTFWAAFEHADTYGSLIKPNYSLTPRLAPLVDRLEKDGDLIAISARQVLEQAHRLSQRYTVVVANPPYMGSGNLGPALQAYVQSNFEAGKADLYAAFILRAHELTHRRGFTAMITMQSWMFIASFEKLRGSVLARTTVDTMAHLGTSAFDSISGDVVSTTAFVLRNFHSPDSRGVYLRLISGRSEQQKAKQLLDGTHRYFATGRQLETLPGKPLAYWLPGSVLEAFNGRLLRDVAEPRVGMATADNARWVRQWWEVSARNIGRGMSRSQAKTSGLRWFPYATSGTSTRWFGNVSSVVDWQQDGVALQTTKHESGRIRAHNFNLDQIFRAGLVWNVVTSGVSSFRYADQGYLFDASAGLAHSKSDLYLLGLLNSSSAAFILNALNPTFNLPPGSLGALPLPIDPHAVAAETIAHGALGLARSIWASGETSWQYAGLSVSETGNLGSQVEAWVTSHNDRLEAMTEAEAALDEHFERAYGIEHELVAPWSSAARTSGATKNTNDHTKDLISYAVGCMFGRYSLDQPGVILANQGDTLQDYLAKVPNLSFTPDEDNVIPVLDGEWFEDDIVAKFRQFLRIAFGEEHFEENLRFVIDNLGVKDLREYFVKSFYKDHVQRYKKRPIYWLFSSPKGSFNALVYLHRYNPSTVSTVLNEYLREYIKKLEVGLEQQEYVVTSGASAREVAAAQREADRLRKVLLELADYERDFFALASRQVPLDLDDGVLVNYQKLGTALKDIGLKKAGKNE